MQKTFKIINQLLESGIIEKYAVGGNIATIFYIEPTTTYDLDIMVILPSEDNILHPLKDIYEWAKEKNYKLEKEHIIIEGIPVQFLPAYNDLVKEAVENAVEKKYKNEKISVIGIEYLIAIMVDTYRPIDKERLIRFLNNAKFDKEILNGILIKFKLKEKYDSFKKTYFKK
jgi:hypothetical protein